MINSKRESRDIIVDILTMCQTPRGKTSIVYGCNLNFNNLSHYLSWCFIRGWLKKIEDKDNPRSPKYLTTELGVSYLNLIRPVFAFEGQVVESEMP